MTITSTDYHTNRSTTGDLYCAWTVATPRAARLHRLNVVALVAASHLTASAAGALVTVIVTR